MEKQLKLLKEESKAYGGKLLTTRKGRARGRPLDTKRTMHLVLRSSHAKHDWSFRGPINQRKIKEILARFSRKYGIQILSAANVGNHLHLQIKLNNRYGYQKFIRATTAAIAMAITGASRWNKLEDILRDRNRDMKKIGIKGHSDLPKRFWDFRPFSRVIIGFRALLTMRDYIKLNQLEGEGVRRNVARAILLQNRRPLAFSSA